MKKILLLIPQNIFPVTDGGKQGLYYPMKILAKHYDVKVVVFIGQNENDNTDEYKKINVDALFLKIDKADSPIKIMGNIFKKLSFKFDRYFTHQNISAVINVCKVWQPNIVICHHAHLALYGKILNKHFPHIQLILREHNIEYIIVKQFAKTNKNYIKKTIAYWQYLKTKKVEEQSWSWFNKVLFISNSDIAIANKVTTNSTFHLLPDGAISNPILLSKKQNAFIFSGSLSALQNEYNLKHFINHIWIPWKTNFDTNNFELWITGSSKDMFVEKTRLSAKERDKYQIKVLGFVDNYAAKIQEAKFFLSPTIIGAGIRMKVLEALSNACVVFLTQVDYDMLDCFTDKVNVVLYDNLSSFNNSINQLSENLCKEIAHNGYTLFHQRLSWDKFESDYIKIIASE